MNFAEMRKVLGMIELVVTDPEMPQKLRTFNEQARELLALAANGPCDSTKVVDGSMTDDGAKYRQHRCNRAKEHAGLHRCRSCGEYFHGRHGHVVGLRARGEREIETIEDWGDVVLP